MADYAMLCYALIQPTIQYECIYFSHLFISDAFCQKGANLHNFEYKYQPSGGRGTRSPPVKSKVAARGPQNGRRGL